MSLRKLVEDTGLRSPKGSLWLKASIAALVSFRKQRLIFAASSCDSGGRFDHNAHRAFVRYSGIPGV
jgi:hypothetical protein